MGVTAKSLGIDQLEIEERLTLIGEIWDGISADAEQRPLSDATRAELSRRVADADLNPNDSVAWTSVKADAEDRLNK